MQWRHNGKGSLNNDKSVIIIIVRLKFFKFKNWSTLLLINSILRVRLRLNLHSVVVTPHHITYSEKVSKNTFLKTIFLNTNLKSRQSVVRGAAGLNLLLKIIQLSFKITVSIRPNFHLTATIFYQLFGTCKNPILAQQQQHSPKY